AGAAVYTDPTQWRRWPSLDALRSGSPMAEPRAAPAAEVVVSGHDVLLATKLHLPRLRPGFVPRPRLGVRLDEGLDRELVLVCAPAGYGRPATPRRWLPAWPGCPGSGRPPVMRPARWRQSARRSGSHPARRWAAWSTRCRRSGRG